jgi:competence protein ComEC
MEKVNLRWILGFGFAVVLGFDLWSHRVVDRVDFLQVGQGDSTLIIQDGTSVLIDAGPTNEFLDAGERLVWPALWRRGVRHLDAVVITHFDRDHYGGLESVLNRTSIDRLILVRPFGLSEEEESYYTSLGFERDQLEVILDSERLTIGSVELDATPGLGGDDNLGSPYIAVAVFGEVFGFSGDAPSSMEAQWMQDGVPLATILKAGHHGSGDSTSAPWLSYHQPKHVVFSCGRNNNWGHPDSSVVARSEANGARIHRTDWDGAVSFRPKKSGGVELLFGEQRFSLLEFFNR